jgi:hypothetical protein
MRALAIIFLSSSLLLAGCSRNKIENKSDNAADKKPAVSRTNTPTQIKPFLDDKEAGAQPGQIVFFNDVRFEPGPTDNAVYAVGPNGGKMLVVLNEPLKPSQNPQARFDVKGAVERTPPTATMRKKWKMKKEEAAEVQKIGVYVESETVSAAGE